jgi:hypothetical protein
MDVLTLQTLAQWNLALVARQSGLTLRTAVFPWLLSKGSVEFTNPPNCDTEAFAYEDGAGIFTLRTVAHTASGRVDVLI